MKMKKLAALITASALCLGMSMTAFAANNPSPDDNSLDIWGSSDVYPGYAKPGVGINEEGAHVQADPLSSSLYEIQDKYVADYRAKYPDTELTDDQILAIDEVKEKVDAAYTKVVDTLWNSPEGRKNIKEAFKENGYNIKDGETPVVIAANNLVPLDKNGNVITDFNGEPFVQQFYIGQNEAGVGVGDYVYVLHYNVDNNTWEVIEAQVMEDPTGHSMYVNVEFKNGLSPVGFIKVMQNGKAIKVDKNGAPIKDENGNNQVIIDSNKNSGTNTNTTATTKPATKPATKATTTGRSPKTGEF